MKHRRRRQIVIITLVSTAVLLLVVLSCAILLFLPEHVDRFLLTDNNYCCLDESRRVNVDGLKNNDSHKKEDKLNKRRGSRRGLLHRAVDSLTWEVIKNHYNYNHKKCKDDSEEKFCPLVKAGKGDEQLDTFIFDECQHLHPVCKKYRTLRTYLRAHKLIIPWNWYYRTQFKLSGLSLHAFTEAIRFLHKTDEEVPWRMSTLVHRAVKSILFSGADHFDATQIDVASPSSLNKSAAIHIQSADFTFQSWLYPVVSAYLNQITINIIIQKGEYNKLLVGDMTITELLGILPKPPKMEGLYPRIGVVNITNITVNVYEGKGSDTSLNLLMKVTLPDNLFYPVTNLTLANSPSGIDRKHFQSLLESAFSNSIRQHLIRESERAFQNSLVTTTELTKHLKDVTKRAQSQLQQYIFMTQELHFDHWWGIIVQGWHQTQDSIWRGVLNGTVPILEAVGHWIEDVKQTPPLALLVSHHWTKLVNDINKHVVPFDRQVWKHINELEVVFDGLIARAMGKDVDIVKYNVPIEKRVSNRLDKLKESFDDLIAKSGGNIERLLQSCEEEMKDKWLDWHKQFFPEL